MIGNDLIYLERAAKNSRLHNFRFRKKVFTKSENKTIHTSENQEESFWLLWSMKEAAYKAHQRIRNTAPKLNPIDFECLPTVDKRSGRVKVFGYYYHTQSQISGNYIYTIASAEKDLKIIQKTFPKDCYYKKQFSEYVSAQIEEYPGLFIEKNEHRIPFFHQKNSNKKLPVSISHDGDLVWLVFPLIKS